MQIIFEQSTTLASAQKLNASGDAVCALNFASAKNPGGGFLTGAHAQEESLARASGLYLSLLSQPHFYAENKKDRFCIYTDTIIYSPNVPVFKDDLGTLLEKPYLLSFVTSPAVNFGVASKRVKNAEELKGRMLERAKKVLAVCATNGHRVLVLGSWVRALFLDI